MTSGSKKRPGESKSSRDDSFKSKDSFKSGSLSSKLNAAEMLSQYKNASLEFGSGSKNPLAKGRPEPQDESEIIKGAYKMAQQLNLFVEKGMEAALEDSDTAVPAESEEPIADIQLKTVRKLRQVSKS
jgi:hypothetical protein